MTDLMDWEPPRCIHGHIILACPDDTCPTQNAYLDQEQAAIHHYHRQGERAARLYLFGPTRPE